MIHSKNKMAPLPGREIEKKPTFFPIDCQKAPGTNSLIHTIIIIFFQFNAETADELVVLSTHSSPVFDQVRS